MGLLHGLGKLVSPVISAISGKHGLGDIATFGLGGLLAKELLGGHKKSPADIAAKETAAAERAAGPKLPTTLPPTAPGDPNRMFPVRPIGMGPGGLSDQPVMMPPPTAQPPQPGGGSVFLNGLNPDLEEVNMGRVPQMRRY